MFRIKRVVAQLRYSTLIMKYTFVRGLKYEFAWEFLGEKIVLHPLSVDTRMVAFFPLLFPFSFIFFSLINGQNVGAIKLAFFDNLELPVPSSKCYISSCKLHPAVGRRT